MPHQLTTSYIKDSTELFRYYKKLVERALAQCPDEGLFTALDEESNCIAIIVKHMAGNMRSRWNRQDARHHRTHPAPARIRRFPARRKHSGAHVHEIGRAHV